MTDYDLPEIPSDEELGITDDDRQAFDEEAGGDSAGKSSAPPSSGPPAGSGSPPQAPPAPPAGPPPLGGARGPIALVVLLLVSVVSTQWWAVPGPAPANAPAEEFSSARAMTRLVEIAAEPHPTGSPENERVRNYLTGVLAERGMEPVVETGTWLARSGSGMRAVTVRNIVARLPGTDPSGTLLLTAHYDSRVLAPGAGDAGIGVVTILETLRALEEGPPLNNDVVVVFTDGEELGLTGMRVWLRDGRWSDDIDVALSAEMRGGGGAAIMFQAGQANGWIVPRFGEAVSNPVANSLSEEVYRRLPNDTDFTPLREAGVQGLNFAGIGRPNVYHQASDRPENVSEATLQHYGEQFLPLVRELGSTDLTEVDAPDVTWFSLPFVGLVVYGDMVTWGLSGLVVLLLLGLVAAGRRRGTVGWGGLTAGVGLFLGLSLAGWGIGAWLVPWLAGFHAEYGALSAAAFHVELWYLLALAAAIATLLVALLGLLRRRFTLPSLTLGGLLVPLLGAVALSVVAPQAAPSLQWPVLAALLATLPVLGTRARQRQGSAAWMMTLLLAVPVVVFLTTLLELIWLALSISLAPALAVGMVVTGFLLLPVLDSLREPNVWWAPLLGIVAAGTFLAVGLVQARPAADRPIPSTLVYLLDRESGEAHWLTGPSGNAADEENPALDWAMTQVSGDFQDSRALEGLLGGDENFPAAPARVVETPAPQVTVVRDSLTGEGRLLRLGIRSALNAERILFQLPADSMARLEAVNELPVPEVGSAGAPVEPIERVSHWGRPEPQILLDFRMAPGTDRLSLEIVEHLLRPEEILGEAPWRRPPELAPNTMLPTDRAVIRTPLEIALPPGGAAGISDAPADSSTSAVPPQQALPGDTLAGDTLLMDTLPADSLFTDSLPPD